MVNALQWQRPAPTEPTQTHRPSKFSVLFQCSSRHRDGPPCVNWRKHFLDRYPLHHAHVKGDRCSAPGPIMCHPHCMYVIGRFLFEIHCLCCYCSLFVGVPVCACVCLSVCLVLNSIGLFCCCCVCCFHRKTHAFITSVLVFIVKHMC